MGHNNTSCAHLVQFLLCPQGWTQQTKKKKPFNICHLILRIKNLKLLTLKTLQRILQNWIKS